MSDPSTPARRSSVPDPKGLTRAFRPATVAAIAAVVFTGAIFGFFYAWVCSTMWALDTLDPRIAIAAMNGMNASVRNYVFFPIFFLTPLVTGIAAVLAQLEGRVSAARLFAAATLVYTVGGMGLTLGVNVPMNEALLAAPVPTSLDDAARVWSEYSGRWQLFNLIRTVFSGVAVVVACCALVTLARPGRPIIDAAVPAARVERQLP